MIAKPHRFHGLGALRPVYQRSRTVRQGEISLRYRPNQGRGGYRAAVVVSKKVHKSAVKRNRIRRRIYELIRQNEADLREPYDLIISVYSDQVIDWPSERLAAEVNKLLTKSGVINR